MFLKTPLLANRPVPHKPRRFPFLRVVLLLLAGAGCVLALGAGGSPSTPNRPARRAPHPDSIASPGFIAGQLVHEKRYAFINYSRNHFEWSSFEAIRPLFDALRRTPYRRMTVLHIGDSHVQADIHSGYARNRMQHLFGDGGRGLVFPYQAANTHAAYDYSTRTWGLWAAARNVQPAPALPLGVGGITARTTDPRAGFSIRFNSYYQPHDARRVRLYCDCAPGAFAVDLRYNHHVGTEDVIRLRCPETGPGILETTVDEEIRYLQLDVVREDSTQHHFEVYGISLESPEASGVLYHSVGINGAGFRDLLKQDLMVPQIRMLNPDVVLLDLGGNEYFSAGLRAAEFEERLRNVIGRVRTAAPQATVVVGCSQDINRYRYYTVTDCKPAAELAKRIALELGCAFYDYYNVAGGYGSMQRWAAYGLAKPDRVHLTYAGYITKGELFANAFLTTYHQLLQGRTTSDFAADELPFPTFAAVAPSIGAAAAPAAAAANVGAPGSGTRLVYTVQSGDNLGAIGNRFGVTVAQLQAWNNLSGTLIRAGQPLVVWTNRPAAAAPPPAPQPGANSSPAYQQQRQNMPPTVRPGVATHTVRSGDSLWGIANTYGTTVEALCQLNGISRSATLQVGQVLRVR
jgi:LysM repeat protein/lysophospholipase L1-like esterase